MRHFAIRLFLLTVMVAFGPFGARADVTITEVTSPGGISAWLVEEHTIPFVAIEIGFRGGTSLDLPEKRGAVYMMTGLLEEGSGDLDATQFLKRRDELAASFSFQAHGDAVTVSARFLTENSDEAMALLRTALLEPRFDDIAVERVRAQIQSIIRSDAKDPDKIASVTFDKLAFGDHPYGSASAGSEISIATLTKEDLVEAHQNSMVRDRMYIGVVGDISAEDLGQMLDRLLGDLPESGRPIPPPAELELTGGVTVVHLDTPQSVAVFGHAGIKRHDPDFFAAYVMNHVLGGSGFTSRLTQEVREKRGLTYGIYSYLAPYDLGELYLGSVASANDRVAEAIEVVREEWRKLAENGVRQEELEAAQKYLTGAYPLRFDGNGRIAGILAGMQMDGLPTSYIATRNDQVMAVTLEDVARVAKRLLRPQDLRVVVVGAPTGLEPTD